MNKVVIDHLQGISMPSYLGLWFKIEAYDSINIMKVMQIILHGKSTFRTKFNLE